MSGGRPLSSNFIFFELLRPMLQPPWDRNRGKWSQGFLRSGRWEPKHVATRIDSLMGCHPFAHLWLCKCIHFGAHIATSWSVCAAVDKPRSLKTFKLMVNLSQVDDVIIINSPKYVDQTLNHVDTVTRQRPWWSIASSQRFRLRLYRARRRHNPLPLEELL